MSLADAAVRKAKLEVRSCRMADGGGTYLAVMPNGSKYRRLRYRFDGKEKRLAFGVYPNVSLGFKCPAELFTLDAFDFRQHHAALFASGS